VEEISKMWGCTCPKLWSKVINIENGSTIYTQKTQIKIRQGKYYIWKGVVIFVLCATFDK
jgi:hypothetical protein